MASKNGRYRTVFARSLRLTVDAFASLGLLLLLWIVVPLSMVVVGLPLLPTVLLLQRRHAGGQRRRAARTLDAPVGEDYRPVPRRGWFARLGVLLTDPATWRDLGWLWLDCTAGLTLAALPVGLWLCAVWQAVLVGVLWTLFPDTRARIDWAGIPGPGGAHPWGYVVIPLLGMVAVALAVRTTRPLLVAHARLVRRWLGAPPRAVLARRVDDLTRTRADSLDLHAAEIRRIERDLHDGAQARLVALGMSLGLAEKLLADRPEALPLLADARQNNSRAMAELRELVHGIHPPVLADRGLAGAVTALALGTALPVDVDVDLPGRPPAPAESAAYFAIAECVANAAKHAGPARIAVHVRYALDRLVITVRDNGGGGADLAAGTGLRGVARRLAAFDGTLKISSPPGGPTAITMEVPCALS